MKHVDASSLSPAPKRRRAGKTQLENRRLRAILDSIEQAVVYWDADRVCRFISAGTHRLLEIDEAELKLGSTLQEFVQKGVIAREITADMAARVLKTGEAREGYRDIRTTRSRRKLMTSVTPDEDGGLLITYTDVTEFKRNETALASAKARAESAEAELSAQLDRITDEKRKIEAKQKELERLSLIAAHAKDLIVISDATNRIEWANEAYRRQNGLDLEMDLIGKSCRDVLVGPETDPDALARIDEAVRGRKAIMLKILCYRREGPAYWMEQEITPVFNSRGEHTHFIMVGRDVTQRLESERLAEEARRFEAAKRDESRLLAEFNEWLQSSDSLEELFLVVSSFLEKLLPGSSGAVYVYANSRDVLEAVCSWPIEGVVTHFEPPECWALRRGRSYFYGKNTVDFPCIHVSAEHSERLPDRYFCLPIIAHGDTVGLLHLVFDEGAESEGLDTQKLANFCAEQISLAIANVKLREQLRDQSTRDPLTGLYNRRYFLDFAKREINRSTTTKRPAALISLDVDHFKQFNDEYGHDAGDTVLKALAETLQTMFREGDVPCRLGGEEFIVMLPGATRARAMERAEALRAQIEGLTIRYGGQTLKITASLGVAAYPDDGMVLEALMREADEALYKAKSDGRNRVRAPGPGD